MYDGHLSPTLGSYPLRELTPEVIGRWQADRLAAGAPVEFDAQGAHAARQCPAARPRGGPHLGQPAAARAQGRAAATEEVRPLPLATVEAIRAVLSPRHALFISLLAYSGIRPQEARGLRWAHVQDRTLVVHAPKTRRHRTQPRTVRLLAPLAQDLREWRLLRGAPPTAPVLPGQSGGEWTEVAYEQWRARVWAKALDDVGLAYQRPYDLRHSFASLLLHEGRSVIYVARQLGHGADAHDGHLRPRDRRA